MPPRVTIPDEIAPRPAFHSLRPVVMSSRGMVVAGTPLAAAAGARMLAEGGTAIDAAIAAAGVQAVVMPHLNGLGGDLWLLHMSPEGRVRALNASGPAPGGATGEAFRARGLSSIPTRGIEAVSVPGAVDGWFRALAEWGRLRPGRVFEPALEYAREGYPVHRNFARFLGSPAFEVLAHRSPALAATYRRDGRPPAPGTRLAQPDLAKTLERVVRDGPDEFYRGETAELIARTSVRHEGFLAREDLARYASEWVQPISVSYRGLTVFQVPPNSQGVTMLQQLRFLGSFDLAGLGHNSPDYIHLLVEAKTAAFADRGRWLADPARAAVPVADLLSAERAAAFRDGFDPRRASDGADRRLRRPRGDTTCLVAVDAAGTAAVLIQSLFEDFGSGIWVEGGGFALHDRMCGFTLEPGHPNEVAPGKRPLHTLCCSVAERDGRPALAYATPGGHAQTQTLVQILNNLTVFGMDVQEAVEAPRFTHEPGRLLVEARVGAPVRTALARRGHPVGTLPGWSSITGGAAAVSIHPESAIRQAGADPRRDSYAVPA
jgi:gamma-glutamyltranspeptidase/glutathione hydrolase